MHPLNSIFALLFVLGTFLSAAQPQKVNYQAVALTAGGQTVKNQAIKLRLSIVDSSATGTVLYTETHQPTTDGAGQFSVFLGGGNATFGTFSNIAWSNGKDKFLKAEADVTGGTNYVFMGTSQMVSVPYALAAGSLTDSAKVIAQDGTQWSLIVGPNGPSWQQSSGPGGLNMNYPCPGVPTVTYSGQTYNTVQIGTQCWFKENLNVGSMIQGSSNQTNNGIIEKYCYNNLPANCDTFGGLYQWAEAVQYQNNGSNVNFSNPRLNGRFQGICPSGWHLGNDYDFCQLSKFLDSTVDCTVGWWSGSNVGEKMKIQGNVWNNVQYNNSSGFSAIPSGFRNSNGLFFSKNEGAYFWTEKEHLDTHSIFRHLNSAENRIYRYPWGKEIGFSIRCLKD